MQALVPKHLILVGVVDFFNVWRLTKAGAIIYLHFAAQEFQLNSGNPKVHEIGEELFVDSKTGDLVKQGKFRRIRGQTVLEKTVKIDTVLDQKVLVCSEQQLTPEEHDEAAFPIQTPIQTVRYQFSHSLWIDKSTFPQTDLPIYVGTLVLTPWSFPEAIALLAQYGSSEPKLFRCWKHYPPESHQARFLQSSQQRYPRTATEFVVPELKDLPNNAESLVMYWRSVQAQLAAHHNPSSSSILCVFINMETTLTMLEVVCDKDAPLAAVFSYFGKAFGYCPDVDLPAPGPTYLKEWPLHPVDYELVGASPADQVAEFLVFGRSRLKKGS